MAVKIYHGVLNRTSGATKSEYATKYDFIEIGGERLMKVAISNLMDNFLEVGKEVTISVYKEKGANHNVCAIRESNGRITKTGLGELVGETLVMFFAVALISALAIFASIVIIDYSSPKIPIILWLLITFVLPYFIMKSYFKARNGIDSFQPSRQ